MVDIYTANNNFTFPANHSQTKLALLAASVAIEITLALSINLFVLIFTICHPKLLKLPSIIYLTNFVLINLFAVIFFMPSVVVTAVSGEWIFGETFKQKMASCQFVGFVFNTSLFLTTFILTAISVDRFLYIVRPFASAEQSTKSWVAILISAISWIIVVSCLISILPVLKFGSLYVFTIANATCVTGWETQSLGFSVFLFLMLLICIIIIAVTSTWTFCVTHNFIKARHLTTFTRDGQKDIVYNRSIRRVFGIFGTMLLVTAIQYTPPVILLLVGFSIGFGNIPLDVYTITLAFTYSFTITNPLIQVFFRKELNTFVTNFYNSMKCFMCQSRKDP